MNMRKLALSFAAVAAMVVTGSAGTYYVAPDGTGSGLVWGDACSFETAMTVAAEGDEIWLKKGDYTVPAGTTYANANAITIRGGFAGDEQTAEERTPGERSRLIGGTSATSTSGTIALKLTATSGTVMIEDLDIESVYQGVYKDGEASFVARNVRVISCGRNGSGYPGRGMYLHGKAWTETAFVTLSNCEFRGNYVTGDAAYGNYGGSGCGTWLQHFTTVTIENCLYYNNGINFGVVSAPGRDVTKGSALFCDTAKLVCRGTRFIGNGCCSKSAGGIVKIYNCTSGSSVENCAFVGNFDAPWSNEFGSEAHGALLVQLGAASHVVNVDRCTFAYNLARPSGGCWGAALSVQQGKAVVRNSIFHGNVIRGTTAGAAADMAANNANATVDIDWSAVDENSALYMNTAGGTLTKGDNMVYGSDPLFPTDTATALALVSPAGLTGPVSDNASLAYVYKSGSDLMAFDFRLPSKSGSWNGSAWVTDEVTSPLIDKGDPASDWTAEPEPNGSCVNLGYLGGTSHASKSAAAEPGIASYVLDAESDYSQPHVRMTMGGAGTYSSTVCFCWGAQASAESGTNGWDNVTVVATGVSNGNFVDARPMQYLTPSSEIAWRVVVMTEGYDDIAVNGTATCGTAYPPWYDRGGGASVIHVRAGATGKGDGTSWTDAYDTFDQALTALSTERPTIWVSASWSLTKSAELTEVKSAGAIYGGFVGTENAPSDRPAGKYTSINGERAYNTFALSNEAAVVIDSFEFYNAKEIAFVKSGNGDLTLRNCMIRDNGYDSTKSVKGRAFRAIGCPEATLRFVNCTFKANQFRGSDGSCGYAFGCAGAHFESLRRVIFDGCLFLENGYDRVNAWGTGVDHAGSVPGREGSYGGIFLAQNTPVTAVNTRFIGNRQTGHGGNTKAMLWIDGTAEKSAFTNCLWTANQVLGYDSQGVGNPSPSGASGVAIVYVNNAAATTPVDFVSCTVAYNPSESSVCGAITVNKGACTVRNSIFYGNLICGETAPADLKLVSGTLDIAYTLFAENSARYFSQTATLGAGMVYGDPKFVASPAEFLAEVVNAPAELPVVTKPRLYPKSDASSVSAAYNLHLIGGFYIDETTGERVSTRQQRHDRGVSPVLTAGDPASPRDRQPAPRGKAINLGYYGNTPNATTIPGGLLLMVR